MLKVKVKEVKTNFCPNLDISGLWLQIEVTDGYGMMHKGCGGTEELP